MFVKLKQHRFDIKSQLLHLNKQQHEPESVHPLYNHFIESLKQQLCVRNARTNKQKSFCVTHDEEPDENVCVCVSKTSSRETKRKISEIRPDLRSLLHCDIFKTIHQTFLLLISVISSLQLFLLVKYITVPVFFLHTTVKKYYCKYYKYYNTLL